MHDDGGHQHSDRLNDVAHQVQHCRPHIHVHVRVAVVTTTTTAVVTMSVSMMMIIIMMVARRCHNVGGRFTAHLLILAAVVTTFAESEAIGKDTHHGEVDGQADRRHDQHCLRLEMKVLVDETLYGKISEYDRHRQDGEGGEEGSDHFDSMIAERLASGRLPLAHVDGQQTDGEADQVGGQMSSI